MDHDATMPMWKRRETLVWKPLEPLGPYYSERWFVPSRGEGAFLPVINRTPEEADKARRMPMPPNLETYAAALTTDEIDDDTVSEWLLFRIPDINRADWIDTMIADHKIAKHTANALLLYPSLDSYCPRCTQVYDPFHRRFSETTCAVLSNNGPRKGFVPCTYFYCLNLPTHARRYCPKINLRCIACLRRGHAASE
jgi:hypothetical protein